MSREDATKHGAGYADDCRHFSQDANQDVENGGTDKYSSAGNLKETTRKGYMMGKKPR